MTLYSKLRDDVHAPALGIYTIVLFMATLWYGGNFPLAANLVAMGLGALALATSPAAQFPSTREDKGMVYLAVALPVVLVLGWAAVQLLPVWPHPIYGMTPKLAPWPATTIQPGSTLMQLALAAGYAASAWALFWLGYTRPAAVIKIVCGIVVLASLYGLVVVALGNHVVFLLPKHYYPHALSATFINRNSFATLAGMGVIGCAAMGLQRVGEISSRLTTRQRLHAFWLLVVRQGWPWFAAAVPCLLALILTSSRAGIASSFAGLAAMLLGLLVARPAVRLPLLVIMAGLAVLLCALIGALGGYFGYHMLSLAHAADTRGLIYQATTDAILQAPWLGSGFGTFEAAFHLARTPGMLMPLQGLIDHAHNTYLELALELGLPAAAAGLVAMAALLAFYLNGLFVRRRAVVYCAMGLGVFTQLALHAMADFSLSMPAVTVAALGLLMPALAQSLTPLPQQGVPTPRQNAFITTPAGQGLLIVALVAVGLGGWQGLANIYAMRAHATVKAVLANHPVSTAQMQAARVNLQSCLAINPVSVECGRGLAAVQLALAQTYGIVGHNRGLGLVYLNMARHTYLQTLTFNPADPFGWYKLAQIESTLGTPGQAVVPLTNSILTGPYEPGLAYARLPLMLFLWPAMDGENRAAIAANVQELWQINAPRALYHVHPYPALRPLLGSIVAALPGEGPLWQRLTKTPLPQAITLERPGQTR